jgi:hypothetical protein
VFRGLGCYCDVCVGVWDEGIDDRYTLDLEFDFGFSFVVYLIRHLTGIMFLFAPVL